MRARIVLTAIWLGSFLLALILVEGYIGKTVMIDGAAIKVLLAEDRLDAMKPIFTIYSAYLAAILGFWFAKPFKPTPSDRARRVRFGLAVVCTVIFNGWILYMIGLGHLGHPAAVMATIQSTVQIAAWISVVVAPVNAYYFGSKAKPQG